MVLWATKVVYPSTKMCHALSSTLAFLGSKHWPLTHPLTWTSLEFKATHFPLWPNECVCTCLGLGHSDGSSVPSATCWEDLTHTHTHTHTHKITYIYASPTYHTQNAPFVEEWNKKQAFQTTCHVHLLVMFAKTGFAIIIITQIWTKHLLKLLKCGYRLFSKHTIIAW